jgi:hypothetical protein
VPNTNRPASSSDARTAASEACSSSSVTNTWNTLLAMTASANSRSHTMSAALTSTHSMSGRKRARSSAAVSGSSLVLIDNRDWAESVSPSPRRAPEATS